MLHLTTSHRAPALAARLAEVLQQAPADPLSAEWIAVPSEGMRRWLALELARHLGATSPEAGDGVAANITRAFPGSLRSQILAAGRASGEADPWEVERLAWTVLDVLHRDREDPVLAPLADASAGASVYRRSRRIADLFDRYHLHRPAMVRAWNDGQDLDGVGNALGPTARWQAHVWRLVRAQLTVPSPPERLPGLLDALRADDLDLDLPSRLTLFGASVLPGGAAFVEVATAVAAHRDVHLFLLDPSPSASARIASVAASRDRPRHRLRAEDHSADLVANPLLRSWGRPARETALLLADARADGFPAPVVVDRPAGETSATVLGRVQAAVTSAWQPEPGGARAGDSSVQFHATHGLARQVEVLRDALLHLLADDPTLTEDDILVLCPALDRMGPYIEAGFGPSARSGAASDWGRAVPSLRYRVADRSARDRNPVVAGLEATLDLVVDRFDGPAVLDFLAHPAVRARHRFSDEDLSRLADWVEDANIRWGLDVDHRAVHGVDPAIIANTWAAGLDRLLLGAAVAGDDTGFSLGDVVPLGIESDDVGLAGRLAELLGALGTLAARVGGVAPLAEWLDLLAETAGRVLAPVDGETWQQDAVLRAISEIADDASGPDGPTDTPLRFVDLRRLISDRLAERAGRPDFFRGGVTVARPDTLRSVPYRVVALLGMDQTAFGSTPLSSDDLVGAAPVVGDSDQRSDARHALLDAVLAAGDHLVVVREGHDLRTNQEVPPAVVVAELMEAVEAAGGAVNEIVHPRQAFDERSFMPEGLGPGGPWSFDEDGRKGAVARRARGVAAAPFLAAPLAPEPSSVIELADIRSALEHPIQFFCTRRLGIVLPRREETFPTRLPIEVIALDHWKIGDRLLATAVAGGDHDRWEALERAKGTLPPGVLGIEKAAQTRERVDGLHQEIQRLGVRPGEGQVVPVDVELPDGTRIVGAVDDRLGSPEPGPARMGFGRTKPKHHLITWVDVMALVASDPTVPWRGVTVFCDGDKEPDPVDLLPKADPTDVEGRRPAAVSALEVAVDWYRRALTEPLPYFPVLSPAVHLGNDERRMWPAADYGQGELTDRYIAMVFGHLDYRDVLELPARPDDPPGAGERVQRLADYLWDAVDATVGDRPPPEEDDP